MEGLNWESPELLNLLCIDQWNGFGFQCDKEQTHRPCMIYIAQVFGVKPEKQFESFDETSFLAKIRPKYSDQEVWITDFLGHDFLTVSTSMFKRIPEVINNCLELGYKILTHTCVKTLFKPGMIFNQQTFEMELINAVNENYRLSCEFSHIRDVWGYLKNVLQLGPLKRHFNWTTPEGKAFCTQLRKNLRSKRPITQLFNHFEKHQDVCRQFGIFNEQLAPREQSVKKPRIEEEEDDCIICLERSASTIVFPCECKVVCETCSESLKTTPDQRTCSRCRREINMVVYVNSNKIEEK